MNTELKRYREIAESLYPPLTAEDGVRLEEIERAEKIYRFRLPKIFREFYMLAGEHSAINYSHERLLSVDCLEIEDNRLIFYEENQAVCYWAIDLSDIEKDDPPVWRGLSIVGQDELEWFLDAEKLSDFLLIMLCWQSVMGGLAFVGTAGKIEASIQAIKDNFAPLEVGENGSGLQIFTAPGKVICLAENVEGTNIDAGASDEERFLEIEALLKIDWSYRSPDDD